MGESENITMKMKILYIDIRRGQNGGRRGGDIETHYVLKLLHLTVVTHYTLTHSVSETFKLLCFMDYFSLKFIHAPFKRNINMYNPV